MTQDSVPDNLSRRRFLQVSATAAGGLMIGISFPSLTVGSPVSANVELGAWLIIEPDSVITIRVAKAEMGQGVLTALPMIVAEELEADWRLIKSEYAPVGRGVAGDEDYGSMLTADSKSVRESMRYLQLAGAEARERLIKAAAERWMVAPAECYADYGRVHQKGSAVSVSYGEVAGDASRLNVANVKTKLPADFNALGLPTKKLDAPAKVDGSAIYSIDARIDNMVYAAVIHTPVLGEKLRSSRFNAIRNMPGVIKTVQMESSIAIVAEHFWQAKMAADALPLFWVSGLTQKIFSNTIKDSFFAKLDESGDVLATKGDITNLMDYAEKTIESDYFVPYLAHAPMEPLNCTVHVQAERVDVWVGTQDPQAALTVVSRLTGVARERVFIHNHLIGGGFGRRRQTDFIEEATRIAMEIDRPVQMIWTREEEIRSGKYRPMSAIRFKAGFDIGKNLSAITSHSVTHSIKQDRDGFVNGVDSFSVEGLVDHPYQFPAYRFSHTKNNSHLTTGYWRSGGHSINAFAMECFVDEMAAAAGRDPIDYRQQLLADKADYLPVLEQLVKVSQWHSQRLPRGTALGMAIHKSHGTICALAAEVTVKSDGTVQVNRIKAVVDCGNLVNPLSAEQQVVSGIVFGLTAALSGKLTIENGRVLEDNLDTYEILKMGEMPLVEVHWALSGGDLWGGLGEPSTPVVAPAICNALYRITGRRIRSLPIRDYYLRVK